MILVDFSNIAKAAIMGAMYSEGVQASIENSNIIRHLIINSIRLIHVKHRAEYGEMVLCCDGKRCWRYDAFPEYKGNRKAGHDKDEHFDWKFISACVRKVAHELRDHSPYRVVMVEDAEADDVVGVLTQYITSEREHPSNPFLTVAGEKVLIVGSDNDYFQLHSNPLVEQFCWRNDKMIGPEDTTKNAIMKLMVEKIMRGESSDGIPSIRNSERCLVEGIKQRPVTPALVENVMSRITNMESVGDVMAVVDSENIESYQEKREKIKTKHQKKIDKAIEKGEPTDELEAAFMTEMEKLVPEIPYKDRWELNRTLIDFSCIPATVRDKILVEYQKGANGSKMTLLDYLIANNCKMLVENIQTF